MYSLLTIKTKKREEEEAASKIAIHNSDIQIRKAGSNYF
jgi:hypothetical protein